MQPTNIMDQHRLRGAFLSNKLLRLVDTIADQGAELLETEGIQVPPRAISTVLMIGEVENVTAADIAAALNQPHQLATQRIDALCRGGLVRKQPHHSDSRRKVLALTEQGDRQYQRLLLILEKIKATMEAIYAEIGCDLAAKAEEADKALQRRSLAERIRDDAAT